MKKRVAASIIESISIFDKVLKTEDLINQIVQIADICIQTYQKNNKILFCGNGGSAADAQHIAAELSGRFCIDRKPLNAEALHVNSSFVTAVANDYGFEKIYSRMIQAVGQEGDILFGISTSGNSVNVINALAQANKMGITTIGLTGESGEKMNNICNFTIRVPSSNTARIQETHILIGHILCQIIEEELFPQN